jgi:hypothetical protein
MGYVSLGAVPTKSKYVLPTNPTNPLEEQALQIRQAILARPALDELNYLIAQVPKRISLAEQAIEIGKEDWNDFYKYFDGLESSAKNIGNKWAETAMLVADTSYGNLNPKRKDHAVIIETLAAFRGFRAQIAPLTQQYTDIAKASSDLKAKKDFWYKVGIWAIGGPLLYYGLDVPGMDHASEIFQVFTDTYDVLQKRTDELIALFNRILKMLEDGLKAATKLGEDFPWMVGVAALGVLWVMFGKK